MARVRYLEKEEVGPEALPIYEQLEERIGKVMNPHRVLAHSPKLLKDWWQMMMTLLFDLELDAKLRELALLRIFQLTGCEYCYKEHEPVAESVGCTKEQIDHVAESETHKSFNELERLVLKYTEGITVENKVDDKVYASLSKHLSERELVELTFCIGNWNGIARFIVPLDLELEVHEDD